MRAPCSVPDCGGASRSRGWCGKHYTRWLVRGDLKDRPRHRPRQARVGYGGLHYRVKADRGPARNQRCVDCGTCAREWSQIHGTEDFEPRCKPCHNKYDGIGKTNKGSKSYLKRDRNPLTGRFV